ncbi:Gfo/Idh/MocA family oxidoreductase [bacterium]|nr:Gfo/Idh/MocA family oxidoreductase [bacterium]
MTLSRNSRAINRREFIKGSAALGATVLAAPALGRAVGANDRINIGFIGCGGMGTHHVRHYKELSKDPKLNISVAGVCDVYEPRLRQAKQISGARAFHDYREMLQMKNLHAVFIATPDHWHAKMSIDAMEAGKDVHVEKPMTLYLDEAKEMAQVAKRTGRIVQVGAEGASKDRYWQARKLVRNRELGKLIWSTGGVYRNIPGGDWNYPIDANANPSNLDWEAFLGPAPRRPFSRERFFRYRKYWDYSGGLAHDLLSHTLAGLQVALGAEFPCRVMASGGIFAHHDRETPDTFHVMADFPTDHTMTLFCTQATRRGVEFEIRGEEASLIFEGETVVVHPEPPFSKKRREIRVKPQPRSDHDINWIECIRSRKQPHYHVGMGYKAMVILCLANRSWREKKMMLFDPKTERVLT